MRTPPAVPDTRNFIEAQPVMPPPDRPLDKLGFPLPVNYEPAPRTFFVAAGVVLIEAASLTDYAAADGYPARERRRGSLF